MAQSKWDGVRPSSTDQIHQLDQELTILNDSLEWFGILKAVLCSPAGKKFLERLERDHVKRSLAPSASHAELANADGIRSFVLQLLADVRKVEGGLEAQVSDRIGIVNRARQALATELKEE